MLVGQGEKRGDFKHSQDFFAQEYWNKDDDSGWRFAQSGDDLNVVSWDIGEGDSFLLLAALANKALAHGKCSAQVRPFLVAEAGDELEALGRVVEEEKGAETSVQGGNQL